jgi:hypothetical protein
VKVKIIFMASLVVSVISVILALRASIPITPTAAIGFGSGFVTGIVLTYLTNKGRDQ